MMIVIGAALLVMSGLIVWFSQSFPYGRDPYFSQTWEYIGTAMLMGGALFALPPIIKRVRPNLGLLVFIFVSGVVMRGMMFVSLPVLEDDFYRYLWDGSQVASGVDPYKYSPAQSAPYDIFGEASDIPEEEDLLKLYREATFNRDLHYRINYPYIKTIYPPLAQGTFAVSHLISPYNLNAWRLVLLIVDCLAFVMCLKALQARGLSSPWVAMYWWNPVILLEVFNSGHMDVLMVPFLFGALWAAWSGRRIVGALALAGAAAIKIWPALLMPALVRPDLKSPLKFIAVGANFGIASLVLLAPQLIHILDPEQGLAAYSQGWQKHSFLFKLLIESLFVFISEPEQLARLITAAIVIAITGWLALRSPEDGSGTAFAMLGAAGALLLLSPTGYPWYLTWIAPFLVFVPRAGFLALMITAPLYYTRFILDIEAPLYEWGLLPLAFGGPLLLLLIDAIRKKPIYA